MNTEAKPTVRKDALVATITLGALGLLWIVFRLYWQGLLLLAAASAVGYLAAWRARDRVAAPAPKPAPAEAPPKRARAEKSRRTKKRKRRK